MSLEFECPFCAQPIEADESAAGCDIECPTCGQVFTLAAPAAPTPVVTPAVRPRSPDTHPHHRPHHPSDRRAEAREERKAKMAIATVLIGAPLVLGGVAWAINDLKNYEPPEKPQKPSVATELFQAAKELEKQSKALESAKVEAFKAKELRDAPLIEARNKYAEFQAMRPAFRRFLTEGPCKGDASIADEVIKEMDTSWKDVIAKYSDPDPGNDPASAEGEFNHQMQTRMAGNPAIFRWVLAHAGDGFGRGLRTARRDARRDAVKQGVPEILASGKYSSTGTGFWISQDGWLLSNEHVTGDATTVDLRLTDGKTLKASVVKTDPKNDIALLKANTSVTAWLPLTEGEPVMGETVFTIGYPNTAIQGVEPKFTDGRVSSLTGLQDNKNFYQTTVPVQPGNSGGPLVHSKSGWVVGIVSARLNGGLIAAAAGTSPENVSYALKTPVIRPFIQGVAEARKVLDRKLAPPAPGDEKAAIERARASTVLILVE